MATKIKKPIKKAVSKVVKKSTPAKTKKVAATKAKPIAKKATLKTVKQEKVIAKKSMKKTPTPKIAVKKTTPKKEVVSKKTETKKTTTIQKTKETKPIVKQATPTKSQKETIKKGKTNQTPPKPEIAKRAPIIGGKRRLVVSAKNLTPELQDVMKEHFPRGYVDYMDKIIKVDKPDGTYFYAITLEVEDAIYLVKIDVNVDTDYEEVEKNLFGNTPDVDDEGNELPETEDDDKAYADDDDTDDE